MLKVGGGAAPAQHAQGAGSHSAHPTPRTAQGFGELLLGDIPLAVTLTSGNRHDVTQLIRYWMPVGAENWSTATDQRFIRSSESRGVG
jgi:hypothetical protein